MKLNGIVEQAFQGSPEAPEAAYEVLGTQFFEVVSQKIGQTFTECGGNVPIVTGTCFIAAKARVCAHR